MRAISVNIRNAICCACFPVVVAPPPMDPPSVLFSGDDATRGRADRRRRGRAPRARWRETTAKDATTSHGSDWMQTQRRDLRLATAPGGWRFPVGGCAWWLAAWRFPVGGSSIAERQVYALCFHLYSLLKNKITTTNSGLNLGSIVATKNSCELV